MCLGVMISLLGSSCSLGDRPASNANSPTASRPSAERRETGRDFLEKGLPEAPGYGLYSYILFGARPTEGNRERYVQVLEAFLRIPEVSDLERYTPACKLNITYLPLTEAVSETATADWFLDHYDYARARILLNSVPGSHRAGPYIISTYKPLTGRAKLSGQYLFQDMSSVPPQIISSWVKAFLAQAEQEHFWEEDIAMQCVLEVRKAIEIAADNLPNVKKAISDWVKWSK